MSKRSNIKWRDQDLKELQRVVKNFNAKIDRVTKNKPHLAEFQPTKLNVKDLKSKIETRSDFKNILNKTIRYSVKGSENVKTSPTGLSVTNYKYKEAKIMQRVLNRQSNKEIKAMGISVQSGTMGQISQQNLRPKKVHMNKTIKEWEKMFSSLENQMRSNYRQEGINRYKENYLQSLVNGLGIDKNHELYKHVQGMDADFLFKHSIGNPILSIDFKYEDEQDVDLRIELIMEEWQELE